MTGNATIGYPGAVGINECTGSALSSLPRNTDSVSGEDDSI